MAIQLLIHLRLNQLVIQARHNSIFLKITYMKKIFLLFALAFAITGFSQVKIDPSTILLIDTTVVEEFRTLDTDGTSVTSYRRVTRQQINEYINKIQEHNDFNRELIDRSNDEIQMYNSMLKDARERKEKLQAEIKENDRRLEAYKLLKNVLIKPR